MREHFLQFAPQKVIPATSIYADCYLNPGNVTKSRMSNYTPIPRKTKCTRLKVVSRGKWPQSPLSKAYIKVNLLKNGKGLSEGGITFVTRLDVGVVTRHITTFPNVYFDVDDAIGIFIQTKYMNNSHLSQYLSAIVNFDDV